MTEDDDIELGMFAHAANGGIRINQNAATGIVDLFACGVVTGGMHGADRLGDLSIANGLVFGKIVGYSAQVYANNTVVHTFDEIDVSNHTIKVAKLHLQKIQEWMFDVAIVIVMSNLFKRHCRKLWMLKNILFIW